MDTIEAMESCTAMRYFEDKPVAREILMRLFYAATRASSPANSQGWEFVIIDDVDKKKAHGSAVSALRRISGQDHARDPGGGVGTRLARGSEFIRTKTARYK